MKSLSMFVAALCATLMVGCAVAPTQTQKVEISAIVGAAVAINVANGSSDPAVWSERASKIVGIAHQLQAVDSGNITSARNAVAIVAPLLDAAHLQPAERNAGLALVVALAPLLDQNIPVGDVRIVTSMQIIQYVIDAASVYVLPAN